MHDQQFDITKAVPRASPKPKVYNPFPDTSALTKRLIREHYPELEDRLIRN
jgi:hypothetical protein